MPFVETGNEGALNGSTPVDIVPVSSGSGDPRHVVSKVSFYNRDTAAVIITLVKDKAGTDRYIASESVQPGETWQPVGPDSHVILDGNDEKLQAFMGGAPATTNPDFDAAYAIVT